MEFIRLFLFTDGKMKQVIDFLKWPLAYPVIGLGVL